MENRNYYEQIKAQRPEDFQFESKEQEEKMKTAINFFGAFMSCLFPNIDKGRDEHNGY